MFLCVMTMMFTACSTVSPAGFKEELNRLQFDPIRFNPPVPERITLENGLVVYLLEDHELPVIHVSSVIRVGSIYEPPERAGLASITGTVMRTGGTVRMSPEEIDEKLEFLGASLHVGINAESGNTSLTVLKDDIDTGLDILSQIVINPAFEHEKMLLAVEQQCQAIRRVYENPQSIAFREFKKLLYAKNPRANLPQIETLQSLTQKDLLTFHKKFFHPERMIIAISGDFAREDIVRKINKYFSSWQQANEPLPDISAPKPVSKNLVYSFDKKVPQSTIIMGHLAPKKSNPDFFSFRVLNYILGGGGFSSRLMSEIRSARGLAYSVGSLFRGDVDYGVFAAYCMTKTSSTHQATSLTMDILQKIKAGDISQFEIDLAKESLLNSFIFTYTSRHEIVRQNMMLEYQKLPADFIKNTPDQLNAVTLSDLKRVADQYLHPDRMIILTVGNTDSFDKPVSSWEFGEVHHIDSNIR